MEVAHVHALVDEADLHSTSRRCFALQREAHDDRAIGVENVVRDGPVNLESALVLRKFLLVHHEGERPKPHRVGVAGELHLIDRREPGLDVCVFSRASSLGATVFVRIL
jgi:hypothetical protein